MKILKNKDGFSYILTCVIVIGIALFIVAVMQYVTVYQVISEQKDSVKLKLDSYVTKSSIAYYDAWKQGSGYEAQIDQDRFTEGAYEKLGFSAYGNEDRTVTESKIPYTMSHPEIAFLTDGSLGLSVQYHLTVPFEVFGKRIVDIDVPVELFSRFIKK